MDVVSVLVHADDELSESGLKSMLAGYRRLRVVEDSDSCVDVLVVAVVGVVGADTFALLRRFADGPLTGPRVVVVADRFKAEDLLLGVECGIAALLSRGDLEDGVLASAITAVVAGAALIPSQLQGVLLEQISGLRSQVLAPAGLTFAGIEGRERDVLRLIAQGCHTHEIAEQLTYSEGTVKNVLYGMMSRLHLNSRSHAVAYALRAGVI